MLLKVPDITQFESIQKTKLTVWFIMNTIYIYEKTRNTTEIQQQLCKLLTKDMQATDCLLSIHIIIIIAYCLLPRVFYQKGIRQNIIDLSEKYIHFLLNNSSSGVYKTTLCLIMHVMLFICIMQLYPDLCFRTRFIYKTSSKLPLYYWCNSC